MASIVMKFAEGREAFLKSAQRMPEFSEAADMCRREIALCQALTPAEMADLEAGDSLPTRERIEELAQRCGYRAAHCELVLRGIASHIGKPFPPPASDGALVSGLREFVVELRNVTSFDDFATAFNQGFCQRVGGEWKRGNLNAFHDFFYWPTEEQFRLILRGWSSCTGLSSEHRTMVLEILKDNPHVHYVLE